MSIAFIFPGSGNHFAGMGMPLSSRWPEIFRRQDSENLYLRSQFQPEMFWNGAPPAAIDDQSRGQRDGPPSASPPTRSAGAALRVR